MLCQKTGCQREATHALQLGVRSMLDRPEAPPRCTVLLGVVVCERCLEGEDDAGKWLASAGDVLRPLVSISMAGQPPDFDGAEITGVSVKSPEYQNLLLQGLSQPKAH